MEGPTALPDAHDSSWVHWLGVAAAACATASLAAFSLSGAADEPATALSEPALPEPTLQQARAAQPVPELPALLSATGLYAEPGSPALHPEVIEFVPQYPLWSDGASKRRYLRLPLGSSIDGSNPDAWVFPVGTRFWKEFSLGRRVETRTIERLPNGTWRFASYAWDEQGRDARLVPEGGRLRVAPLARTGLHHDIPSRGDCVACHEAGGGRAPVLGFTALQLSPDRDPRAPHAEVPPASALDLTDLIARGLVRSYPAEFARPRIEAQARTERAALGYLHANCAGCHNAHGALADLELDFEQSVGTGAGSARVLESVLRRAARFRLPDQERSERVVPGEPAQSVVQFRLSSRQLAQQMPPLGSKVVDQEAAELVAAWIAQLKTNAPHGADQETP
jgi:cytochrome c553